jgi:hypothetical protein
MAIHFTKSLHIRGTKKVNAATSSSAGCCGKSKQSIVGAVNKHFRRFYRSGTQTAYARVACRYRKHVIRLSIMGIHTPTRGNDSAGTAWTHFTDTLPQIYLPKILSLVTDSAKSKTTRTQSRKRAHTHMHTLRIILYFVITQTGNLQHSVHHAK